MQWTRREVATYLGPEIFSRFRYFSSVLIQLAVTAHPVHIIIQMQWNVVGAVTSHAGFDCLLFKGRPFILLDDFFHRLHHRFCNGNCNCGNRFVPLDGWFGTHHDGTPEAMARIRKRQRARSEVA